MLKSFYRRNLPHLQRDDKPHFLTFCTLHRKHLPGWAREIVLSSCLQANQKTVDLYCVVVMPDHVHMIFVPLVDRVSEVVPLSRITRAIKGASAHLINRQLGRSGRVWQEESFDRVLRSSEKLEEKIRYVLENPARKELVSGSEIYPWFWVAPEFLSSCARPGR